MRYYTKVSYKTKIKLFLKKIYKLLQRFYKKTLHPAIKIISNQIKKLKNTESVLFITKTLKQILKKIKKVFENIHNYLDRLFFPLYLFPIKLVTYTLYYLVKLLIKTAISLIKIIIDSIIFPFKSLKNFLKSVFVIAVTIYLAISFLILEDYLEKEYGHWRNILCGSTTKTKLKDSVVRVVGGYSEGSGFFVDPFTVLTNFHVIYGEPSPKVIFPDGSFATPYKIVGNRDADMALLHFNDPYYGKALELMLPLELFENEPLISAGYPFGTSLAGEATLLDGNFLTFRKTKDRPVEYIHTNIQIDRGMSGGPLVDKCGRVVGINTFSLGGTSLFISIDSYWNTKHTFTDQYVAKINLDPSASPEEAVKAFYTYLKVRDMEAGFNLLSKEYLKKTNFEEWTSRFTDILDVNVIKTEKVPGYVNKVYVKFSTKNWVDGEVEFHYYEGNWDTVFENGVYKMLFANIEEVDRPGYDWFWTSN